MTWNFGDIFDGLDRQLPGDAPAIIHKGNTTTWSEFARRTNNIARALQARGAQPGDKVAFYMRNGPAYPEALVACLKARLAHVNINFRYRDQELWYILDNSDSQFVVFDHEFLPEAEALRRRLPKVTTWIQVGKEPETFCESYENLALDGSGMPLEIQRSAEDLLLVYTGGTTGMPKGVMWRAEDLWFATGGGFNNAANKGQAPQDIETHLSNVTEFGPSGRQIPCCPLMHGTGLFTTLVNLVGGGCIIILSGSSFNADEAFDVAQRESADSMVIVGDAFAKPMLNALDAEPGRWDLSSVKVIVSSGVMWSRDVKQALLKHHQGMILVDLFGSSEAIGFGTSITTAQGETKTAKFQIGDRCKVFNAENEEVVPGSGERGVIARSGPIPIGYYKDPEKSEETFPVINGVRYSIPGDWCTVEEDGTITLLGRGSNCINSAGEKIYPEEIEEALKIDSRIEDALVVGVPDDRWGHAVVGIVELSPDAVFNEEEIRSVVREQLSNYKVPKRLFTVPIMFRAPNGKADYKSALALAIQLYIE